MRSSRRRRLRSSVLCAAVLLAGCTAPSSPPAASTSASAPRESSNWPSTLSDFRFHWNATPGIDLETGPAVPLRAYIESYDLVGFAGGDMSAAYPGFLRATPENGPRDTPGYPIELGAVRPEASDAGQEDGGRAAAQNLYGFAPFYVSSLERVGDGYRALVCTSEYSVFQRDPSDPSKYTSTIARTASEEPPNQDRYGIIVWRVELSDKNSRDPADQPAAPSEPQRGPAPAPNQDVFGPWSVTAASYTLWGNMGAAHDVGPPGLQQQCANDMPDDAAARKQMYTGSHDQPPSRGDAIPGWPAESS